MTSWSALRIAAWAELGSLVVLLVNLATVHLPQVSSAAGPVHGCAYLLVIVLTWQQTAATGRVRLLSWVPGAGGLLVTTRLGRAVPSGDQSRDW
ncbi:hypothetical protein JOF53_006422 [Crossiella equi]|uniref:DUF3817 domain-containing protein n=1 Tax=Crossiella equi TaxID=130796 RepID=A0ABS5APE8_9PSEU|nr:hypothetical protein [Crossiella equi]MBP2477550.1 hypothetical protein [Crossiella equi]